MTFNEIHQITDAIIYCTPDDMDREISIAYSSDVMSDVLALATPGSLLITGLRNPQVIRTAEMQDIPCVIFTRGKVPTDDMLDMAREADLCILGTTLPTFTVCGLLYENGLKGFEQNEQY